MKEPWRALLSAFVHNGTLREIEFTGDQYPRPELYGFLTQDQPAKDGICFHCGDGGLKIVWTKHDDKPVLYVVCHECGSHKISESQLRQWKIIRPVFFEKLAATFGVNHSVKSVVPEMVWLLGQKDGIEYYFVRYVNILKPTQVTVELLKSPKSVVLTTNETFTEILQQFLPQPCLALETVVTLNQDGTMTADISEQLKVAFPEPSAPPYEFRKKGEMWVIRFDGEDMYLKDSVGLQCIGQLLAKPNAPMFVMELRAILNGQKPDVVAQPLSREDIVDQETLTNLKHRYLELQSELEEAQNENNEIMEAEVEQEMENIIQYLSQVKAVGGTTRKVNDEIEKARSATSKAFWRSVNQIRCDLPELADHLEKSCVVGMVCNYTPEQKFDWVL